MNKMNLIIKRIRIFYHFFIETEAPRNFVKTFANTSKHGIEIKECSQ